MSNEHLPFCILCSCDSLSTSSTSLCQDFGNNHIGSISAADPSSNLFSGTPSDPDFLRFPPQSLNNGQLFNTLCRHIGINVPLPDPSIFNINSDGVQTFCTKCSTNVSEIFCLTQNMEEIKSDISKRVELIKQRIVELLEVEQPSIINQKPEMIQFVEKFRQKVKKKVSSRTRMESDSHKDKMRGQGPPYQHIVEIQPSLMHQNLRTSIKHQHDDSDEDDSFSPSASDIDLDFSFNMDNESIGMEPEDGDSEDIDNKSDIPRIPNFRRKLRPRVRQNRIKKQRDFQESGTESGIVKLEPESEDDEQDQSDFFDIEPDEVSYQPPSESDMVNDSNSSDEEEQSDPDDDDWGSVPSKRTRLSRSRASQRAVAESPSKTDTRKRPQRACKKSRLQGSDCEVEKWDIIFSPDGRIFYENIEIFKTETKSGMILKCGECSREFNVTRGKKTTNNRASPYYKIKLHIKGTHLGTYNCKLCSKPLSCSKSLSRHNQRHHSNEVRSDGPKAHCEICGKPFKTSSKDFLFGHNWSHKSEEEKAAEIAKGVKPPLTYAEKVEALKQKKQDTFPCPHPECGKVFMWRSLLKKHENRVHVPENQKIKNFACHVCGKLFAAQGDLTAHKKFVCEKDKLARLFFCSFCEKNFTMKDDCVKHERKHTKEKPFQCTQCLKWYSQEKSLKRHYRDCKGKEENMEKYYQGVQMFHEEIETGFIVRCGCCDYSVENVKEKQARCDTYRKIHLHIQGKHLGAFKCRVCDKQLSDPKGLKNHLETHEKEGQSRPKQVCEICGKPFKTNNKKFMLSHHWSHMSEEEKQERIAAGESPPLTYAERMEMLKSKDDSLFQCDQCGKTFAWQCQLRKHERVHSGDSKERRTHQCAACGKFYATADSLNSHVKHVHDKNRVHKWHYCSFCDKKFSHKFAWSKHERSHRRDTLKPFQCQVCAKAFSQEKNYQNHIKQCHSNSNGEDSEEGSSGGSSHNMRPAHVTASGTLDHRNQGPAMPLPLGGPMIQGGNGLQIPQSVHQQFRQGPQSLGLGGSGAALPPGHHFMAPGVPGSSRFFEEGNMFQTFF